MNSDDVASPYAWYAGIPMYRDLDGEWMWTETGPLDIDEFFEYRERLLTDPDIDFAVYDIVCTIIETQMIVKSVMERITSS